MSENTKIECERGVMDVGEKIIAFKGLDRNFSCRGHQFEVGKTYEVAAEKVKVCEGGFHACTNPIDIWKYYGPYETRYARVECLGITDTHKEDSKIACEKIKIVEELSLSELLKEVIDSAQMAASGNSAQMAASGDSAQMAASGNYAQMAASGYSAQMAASGNSAKMAASGDYAQMAASGDYAQMAASGNYAQMAASGDYAKMAASGNYAQMAASGDYAKMAASGNSAKMAASGDSSVISSSGGSTIAKGGNGTWISLAEFDNGKCIGFAIGCIGQNGLEEDTWYKAAGGKLAKV